MADLKQNPGIITNGEEPKIKKPASKESLALQDLSKEVLNEYMPKIATVYNEGKARDFSAKRANLAKFTTYGSKTFGKLGFDPFVGGGNDKKSGMDALYDNNTSGSADVSRAATGMFKLAGIGIQDTFGLGAFADSGNYLDFEETMNKYSSSRGGQTGFWSNTMLSSGYTMGIIGGIVAEEAALAGITALSGLTAAPATALAGATVLTRGLERIKNAGNLLKTVNKLQDVGTASTWLGRNTKKFVKGLVPLENTFDFVKDVEHLKTLNGWQQAATGVGAVVRDARKITMAHGESKLEADMAAKEFKQKQFNDYFADPENAGKSMTDEKAAQIEDEGNKLSDRVYASNFGLIYATNAITFDNMFKNLKSSRKAFNLLNDAYKVSRTQGGKVAVDVVAKTFGNAVRKKLGQVTWKSAVKSALSSSMEGVQELGQDVISETFKSYHARNVKGTQVRGGIYDLLHTDLVDAAKGIATEEGGITFLSGALMGVFASPMGVVSGQMNNFIGGGAQKTYQRAFKNEEWKAQKISIAAKRKEKAKDLTNFFNDNKNFIDGFSHPIYSQNELQEDILNAAENNNQKTLKNKQHESFVTGVHKLLEAGLENEFADHLEKMADQFGPAELNEVFARTDITEENQGKYKNKLKSQAAEVKKLRAVHDEIKQNVTNPNSLQGMKISDPDYLPRFIKYRAFENFKKELLFSHAKIADRGNRLKSLKEELDSHTSLTSFEVNSMVDTKALSQQIELLQLEVDANDKMKLSGTSLNSSKVAKEKLKAYTTYQEKLLEYKAEQNKDEGTVYESDSFDDLFEAYNNLIIAGNKDNADYKIVVQSETERENNKKVFEKIFDYINLGQENEYYQEYVDTLMNPTGSSNFIKGQEEMLQRLEDNKEEHISNALEAFEEKTVSSDMLNALYDAGLFFDLNELDELIKDRIMPSEIFDIENDNKAATQEQIEEAQQIINSYIKKLTGKSITSAKNSLNKQGRKLKSDKRTVNQIIAQYKLKLNKEIKLSSKEGQKILDKLTAGENKFLTKVDREILDKLGEQDVSIKFVTNASLPVTITADGVIEMDLRFTGKDFKNSVMSFENLMVTGLTQHKIAQQLKEDDDLWLATRHAMEQAKEAYVAQYSDAKAEELDVFEYPELFLTEAMNDLAFQDFLADIDDNTQPTTKSLWGSLTDSIKEIVEKDFEKKLVGRVINIAAKALDSSIIEEIGEKVSETQAVDKEAQDAKLKELKTLASELGLRWNVNVEVLATQEEALKILQDIKDPFFQKFSDILQDALYGAETMGFRLQKGINDVSLKDLITDVYNKSDSLSELISNLKELSIYQTDGKIGQMVDWLANNADNIGDGLEMVKNIFFQVEGQTTGGFYDEKTNTAYIVADAVKPNTAYHEIFLHPFLINLEKSNPEFFKQLVAEAKQNAEAVAYVEKNYGTEAKIGARHFEHELVGRVYDLNVNNKLDKTKNAGLIKRLAEFIKKMMNSVAEFFGISKSDIKRINEKKATIADIAKYSVAGTAKMDLGKVIEADAPVVTPTTKKVTRERVITIQQDVNKGGNVISILNASDRPDVFGEYLHPEIIFDTPIVNEWTQKIQELGQELDAAGITNWKYGKIRADVDNRLVIDVSAEVPIMGTTTTTTNTPNAKVVKLKAELDAIEERIINLSKAITGNDKSVAVNAEYEASVKVINFSKGKFPGKNMPLYQHLRMLNKATPTVGEFAYHIKRDNTTDPAVERLGKVIKSDDKSFIFIDAQGNTITQPLDVKTIEFSNPYYMFSDSEITDDITYDAAEKFIKDRRDEKLKEARDKTATIQSFRTDTKALEEHWDKANKGQLGISPIGVDFITVNKEFAKAQLKIEAKENKKLFGKVKIPTNQEIEERAKQLFIENIESTTQDASEFEWTVMDALGGYDTKFKSSDNLSMSIRDVRDQPDVYNYNFHENYDGQGRRFVAILIPVSDPTNPTRSSKFAGISILIPDGMNASDVAKPILEEAFKLNAGSAITTTAQMKDMAIPMAKKIIEEKLKNKTSQSNPNAQKIQDLQNQKKDLEEQLSNEPESIPFSDTQNAQTGTKTVKFLMYKSTGTGSSAESKGEWVPLIAIGKHSNGDEWFVKARHNGEDPKFNKYGSSTFAAIDEELKKNEGLLFDDYENWVTEDVTETIREEIEVPVEDETEETPFENLSNRSTESYVNDVEKIQASINTLEKQIDKLNAEINSSEAGFVQKRAARNKITKLSIELNDLYLQLNDITPAIQNITPAQEIIITDSEYVPEYDYNNNEIITSETPWITVPEELRKNIALVFGKPLNKLDAQDILKIKEEMKSNPLYISVISDFTNKRLDEQNKEIGLTELIENKKKVEAAKIARQAQIQSESLDNKNAKRAARQAKPPVSDEEFLSSMLKGFDVTTLSPKEIKMLVKKFREATPLIPFTAEDIIAYVSHKQAEAEFKRKAQDDLEVQKEQNRINKIIKQNFDLLSDKKIKFVNSKNKIQYLLIPANGMVKFISTYHPEIFQLEKTQFIQKVKEILDNRLKDLKELKGNPITFKPKAIHLQLHNLVKKLEKSKKLYPDTVKKINLALYNAGSDLRIKAVKSTKTSAVSTMYTIGKKSAGESRMPVKKGKYGNFKEIVKNAEFNFSPEINAQLAIVKFLMNGDKVRPSALIKITGADSTEFTEWENITDEEASEKTISPDGVGDHVLESYSLSTDEALNAFDIVIKGSLNLKDAIEKYAKIVIKGFIAEENASDNGNMSKDEMDELYAIELLIEKGLSKEEAASEITKLQFFNSPEGREILNKEYAEIEKYRASMEAEIINGEFEGESDDLTDPQQDLLTDAEKKGLFGPQQLEEEKPEEEINVETIPGKSEKTTEEKELQSEIEKQVTAFFEDINELESLGVKVNKIIDTFNKLMVTDLVYAAAAYRYITNPLLPVNQNLKNNTSHILSRKFSAGHYNDQVVIINNKIYRISGFQNNKIFAQDLVNPNVYAEFSLDEFLNSIDKVVKPGEEFNNLNIDSLVKVAEFDYIKGAYNEILDNFTSFMSEAMALPDEELMSKLKNEITKCK